MQDPNPRGAAGAPVPGTATTPSAAAADGPASEADQKRGKMAKFMVGSGAVIAIGSVLPWATATGEEGLNGFGWGPGKITLVCGILLGLYGYQALRKDDPNVRHHGWAIATVTVSVMVTLGAVSLLDEINSFTFGVGDIGPGFGLILAGFASLFAIWPLVQLRKDAKARALPAGARQARSEPQQAAAEAGWYADPMSRHERRYFDGSSWSEHVVDGEVQSTDPVNR